MKPYIVLISFVAVIVSITAVTYLLWHRR